MSLNSVRVVILFFLGSLIVLATNQCEQLPLQPASVMEKFK